jgi:multidrug efflux pump subunit AcrA (membrane-fusion protein)
MWMAPGPVAAAESNVPLEIVTVESQTLGATTLLGGTVVPREQVTLAAQLAGRVVYLAGEEGDWFRAREILVSLDKDQLLAERAAAVAAVANVEAAWRAARAELWRQYYGGNEPMPGMESFAGLGDFTRPFSSMFGGQEQRYGSGIHRGTDVYAARQRAEQAEAEIQVARARIGEIDSRLRDSDSVAPFTGVIARKHVEVGDTVQAGQPLLQVADIRRLQAQVEVPARIVAGLKVGMIVLVRLDIGDMTVDTRVAQIYPMADPLRHTVTVKLDLPTDAPAAPGMYVEAMVPDASTPVEELPVVPASALVWSGSLPAVFAIGPDNRPELRMVRAGERFGDRITILSGLSRGERIVANPPPGMLSESLAAQPAPPQ